MSTKPKTFVKFWHFLETCLSGGTGSALFSLLSLMRNSTENCDLVRSNELKKCLPKPCFGGSGVVSGKVCSGGSFCVASRSLWTSKKNAQKVSNSPRESCDWGPRLKGLWELKNSTLKSQILEGSCLKNASNN